MSTPLQNINVDDLGSITLALEAMKNHPAPAPVAEPGVVQGQEFASDPVPQPDSNGEFASPLDGALWMAATHNKRQHPLKAQDKPPLLAGWEQKATTDLTQIRAWAMEYPGCNFGSVADEGPIVDVDSPNVRERFGKSFSNTLTVISSESKDGQKGHRYYLPADIEAISQKTKHGDFSLRKGNMFCVTPGSVHPSGKKYRIAINVPMAVPTADEITFWNFERAEKNTAEIGEQTRIPSGQRNPTLASIGGKLLDIGVPLETAIQNVIEINELRCDPPLSREELESTIFASMRNKWSKTADSITRQVQSPKVVMGGKVLGQPPESAAPANWRDSFKSVNELEQGDVRMLIDGFLPEGTTFIGGLPGEGKTFFALSIAKALTTGDPFLEKFFVPETIPVIYLIPESGGRAFRKRCEKFNIPNDPELFLCRTVSEGSTLPLDDRSLLEAIRRLKPVVILDTIIRFSEAQDENQAMQNKALVDDVIRLRQHGAVAVIGLHHATKAMREKGMTLESALRGTGDIAASADAVYGLLRDSMLYNNGLGPNEIDVACLKPRDFEPPMPFRIAATQKSDQGLIKFESVIDRYKDFLIVSKSASEQASSDTLERLVKEDPAMSIEELAMATGQTTWQIRKALKARHWIKSRGGAKHGSRWVASSASGFETESVNPPSNVRPTADVNFESVAANQVVN